MIFLPAALTPALIFSLSFCFATHDGCISFSGFFSRGGPAAAAGREPKPPLEGEPPKPPRPALATPRLPAKPPLEAEAGADVKALVAAEPFEGLPQPPSVPEGTTKVAPPRPRPAGPPRVLWTNPPRPPRVPRLDV